MSHTVYHKASQMVRGQTVAQPHCQFQRLLIVHGFESSTHAHQYTISGQRYLLLSDKLLEVQECKGYFLQKKLFTVYALDV